MLFCLCLIPYPINANFPTILPNELVEIYNHSDTIKFAFKTDILEKENENEIQLKNIKRIIGGIQGIDTSSLMNLINRIIKVLKNIVGRIISIEFKNHAPDNLDISIKETITYPSLEKMLTFYSDMSATIAILQEKNNNYLLSRRLSKRHLATDFKTFPSITEGLNLITNPVGCKLRLKRNRNTVPCLSKYLDQVKIPKMTYIGSDILNYITKLIHRPISLLKVFEILQIVQKLDLVGEIAILNKRDRSLYSYEIPLSDHLNELLTDRLSKGPTSEQITVYSNIGIIDNLLLSNVGYTEPEAPYNDYPELTPGPEDVEEGEPDQDVQGGVDDPLTTATPDPTPSTDNEPVTVSSSVPGNDIGVTEKMEDSNNSPGNKHDRLEKNANEHKGDVKVDRESEKNETDMLNDTTADNAINSNPRELEKMAESIAKINELMLVRINEIDKKIEVHEKEAKGTLDKNEEFVKFQIQEETPLIIKNGISNLLDFFLQLNEELGDLMKTLNSTLVSSLFSSVLTNKTYKVLDKGYNPNTKQLEVLIREYNHPVPMYKYDKLPFCGLENCLMFDVEGFFSETVHYNQLYLEKHCTDIGPLKYSCQNYTKIVPKCVEFNTECPFSVFPLSTQGNKVYLGKYLFLTSPMKKNLELPYGKTLEADTFNIITVNRDIEIEVENKIYKVFGQNQPFKIVVNTLHSRSAVDKMLKKGNFSKWEITQPILNTLFILLTNVGICILVTVFCLKNKKKCRGKKACCQGKKIDNSKTHTRYFKIGNKLVFTEPDPVDSIELQ